MAAQADLIKLAENEAEIEIHQRICHRKARFRTPSPNVSLVTFNNGA